LVEGDGFVQAGGAAWNAEGMFESAEGSDDGGDPIEVLE
jgi:hypothetical protein